MGRCNLDSGLPIELSEAFGCIGQIAGGRRSWIVRLYMLSSSNYVCPMLGLFFMLTLVDFKFLSVIFLALALGALVSIVRGHRFFGWLFRENCSLKHGVGFKIMVDRCIFVRWRVVWIKVKV